MNFIILKRRNLSVIINIKINNIYNNYGKKYTRRGEDEMEVWVED